MKLPELTVVMTVNNRSYDVLNSVFDSLRAQPYANLIVVADGIEPESDEALRSLLPTMPRATRIDLARPRGWLCPAKAWNLGLERIDTELSMMISSDTIQGKSNITTARTILSNSQGVVFGAARCSIDGCPEVTWNDGTASHVLCDAAHPRPLGFVVVMPTWAIRACQGFDEGFMAGHWYDDDDLFFRIWATGLNFAFVDDISGVHIHHERAELSPLAIEKNKAYILSKYGVERPLEMEMNRGGMAIESSAGKTLWRHRCQRCSVAR